MKVAVIGLGMEGRNALYSLLSSGHQVYASDMNKNLKVESDGKDFELDLGSHDWNKINSADAIVLSPGLWNLKIFNKLKSSNKILSDVLKRHRSIFTIGVTGTNGKTTTCYMIKDILEKSGFNVLLGGNAGGGFEGYTEIMLEAAESNFDILVVEVCDMTLDFCSYNFDFDLVVVTNLGIDHLNVHKSLENYQKSVQEFIKNKQAVLNINDELLVAIENYSEETFFFDCYPGDLKLFGKFNCQNAAAAAKVAEILNIPNEEIVSSLASFNPVAGRITELDLDKTRIIIGKTDNAPSTVSVIQELNFDAMMIGTPRKGEYWRYDIFKELANTNTQLIGLFPGLDNTTLKAMDVLKENGYQGKIIIFNNTPEVIKFIIEHKQDYDTLFVGGNGQARITEIKDRLMNLTHIK